jgi:tRNA threonylcarbamoyladenosine biosynthesis protein TsaB
LRILAVDTTTAHGSVALLEEGETVGEVRLLAPDSHSRWLMSAIAFLVEGRGLSARDVAAYAVANGPGSFTGLRVGISTVQGLALASSRPCLGISALDALADGVRGCGERLVAMMDAFRDEVYVGVYDREGGLLGERRVTTAAALAREVTGPVAFVGDGAEKYRGAILAANPGACFPSREPFLAVAIGRLAAPRLARGEGGGAETLRPLYLREADIRRPAR